MNVKFNKNFVEETYYTYIFSKLSFCTVNQKSFCVLRREGLPNRAILYYFCQEVWYEHPPQRLFVRTYSLILFF
jgi:hypothetical protein